MLSLSTSGYNFSHKLCVSLLYIDVVWTSCLLPDEARLTLPIVTLKFSLLGMAID